MSDRPDPETLRVLAELLGVPDDDALPRLRDLQATQPWLEAAIAEIEALPLDEWQGEHTRLFISGYPKTVCPPFASVYREGRMSGTAAGDLAGLYGRVGLEADSIPADYLGAMLECASYLLENRGKDEDLRWDTHWHELWDVHMAPWVPKFAADLEEHSQLALYRMVAAQLGRFFPRPLDV